MRSYKVRYEDEFEAGRSTIEDSDRSYKEVAAYLFPHLKIESAYSRLKACLNSEKDERLSLGQYIAMANFCGRYDVLYYLADVLDHKRPEIRPHEDEKSLLMQQFIKKKDELEKTIERLEKLMSKNI